MDPKAEFDVVVYGASGYTGRLVAEHLARRYGDDGEISWAMAGRSAGKLAAVRDEIGAPKETPLLVADASDAASLDAMVRRAKAVITTVGPYQLYGDALIAACAAAGADYLDLTGEPNWMARTVAAHQAAAKASGARLVHSAGFDSIPFELGVLFCEETARQRLGAYVPRVKGRVRAIKGGLSGGTAASGAATRDAVQKDPSVLGVLMDPFALTPGFRGPDQPAGDKVHRDPDLDAEVGPFMMAMINTKNVHRSNYLMDHPWGRAFQYDEMAILAPGAPTEFTALGDGGPKPGEGPSREERETGFFDILFVGLAAGGRQVRVSVKGDKDPGYGSTSKMLAEAALCLVKDCPDTPGGVWTPGAAMGMKLVERLQRNAGLTFAVE
ncbi:MAG TPA: saccharopine dehydrogenase NADP-binding domain-containing protein [Phenylobacterium sp.]|uniref:saccharopine dehydrogenase family protein n=1 Tax=Phenylobacterium sp. TaxID=1871053 RepID=UPI002C47C302|nr:saccharopine dehydrogenase NADP-binding domain-containing protein [Phenylobacterium sp.]HSV02780.1 saccharopine dehydrogenase NADP-binding domain-containing protein [Phenylobacterium sp.]